MAELAREEIESVSNELNSLTKELKILLLPKDPLDEKNVMLEVGSSESKSTYRLQISRGFKSGQTQ